MGATVTTEPLPLVRAALSERFVSEDGDTVTMTARPGLSDPELEELRRRLPMPLPAHVERLLRHCAGIEGLSAAEILDFTGTAVAFEQPDVFPHAWPIAPDGWGNFWVADLQPSSTDLGPIYFACHDAPIVLFQSATLGEFIEAVFQMNRPPYTSVVDDVHEDRLYRVWTDQPGLLTHEEAVQSTDPTLRTFAAGLSGEHVFVDLRHAVPGQGFAWGRYASVQRCGAHPIFALEKKRGFFGRLLRRRSP